MMMTLIVMIMKVLKVLTKAVSNYFGDDDDFESVEGVDKDS